MSESDTPIFTEDIGIPSQCREAFAKLRDHVRSMPDHKRQEAKDGAFDQMCFAVRIVAGILSDEKPLSDKQRTIFVNYFTQLHLAARAFGDTDMQVQAIKMSIALHKTEEEIEKAKKEGK